MPAPYHKQKNRDGKPTNVVCRENQRGRCSYGTRCRMIHEEPRNNPRDSGIPFALLCLLIEKYNMHSPEAASLDLAHLGEYEEVRYHHEGQHPFDPNSLQGAECIASVVAKKYSTILHLSFRKNDLRDPSNILAALAHSGLTGLNSMTFSSNPITDMKFAAMLKPFRTLQTINLADCPCHSRDRRAELHRMLVNEIPWLLSVDGESVVHPPLAVPWFLRPSELPHDSQELRLLETFEAHMSHTKKELLVVDMYAATAVLTLTILPTCKIDAPKTTSLMPLQIVKDYAKVNQRLQAQNYNLVKAQSVADVTRCSATVLQGKENIATFLQNAFCPSTEEGISMSWSRSCVSIMQISPSQNMISVTGSLSLTTSRMPDAPARIKHFDRTLVVSRLDGLITNDAWNIRHAVSESATWSPVVMGSRLPRALRQFGDKVGETIVRECLEGSMTDKSFLALVEVVSRTKLLVPTARSLLDCVPNWDVSAALTAFEESKESLTPAHYYSGISS